MEITRRSLGLAPMALLANQKKPMFEGMPLRYLIGTDSPGYESGCVIEVGYDVDTCKFPDRTIAYCNLFDEKNTGKYGPYLHTSDTAQQYGEGQIDPRGLGWEKNITEQFTRRKKAGFRYIELDNSDAYRTNVVIEAIKRAKEYDFDVVAKNAALLDDPVQYLQECVACIVEKDAGTPQQMHDLRTRAGKPAMMVWFVAFGRGLDWANRTARKIKSAGLKNMGVTYSRRGEYASSEDILRP